MWLESYVPTVRSRFKIKFCQFTKKRCVYCLGKGTFRFPADTKEL